MAHEAIPEQGALGEAAGEGAGAPQVLRVSGANCRGRREGPASDGQWTQEGRAGGVFAELQVVLPRPQGRTQRRFGLNGKSE